MGNSSSWGARYDLPAHGIAVNLSGMRVRIPYAVGTEMGAFYLNLNLGHHMVELHEVIEMARSEQPVKATMEVQVQKDRRITGVVSDSEIATLLQGVPAEGLVYASQWRRVCRLDTDIGLVIVECRVTADVACLLRVEKRPATWVSGAGYFLLGRANGTAEVFARARFEREEDRRIAAWRTVGVTAAVVIPVILLRWFASRIMRRLGRLRSSSKVHFIAYS